MNKNILLVILAVVVVGLGLFLILGGDEESNESVETSQTTESEQIQVQPENQTEEAQTDGTSITYTDDGFEPEDVTVKVGQTVTFVNNSSASMWVASDDHPTHTDMPEFDNKQGVGPGESYEFTFDEVGEWGYHDHLNSSQGGTVTVVAE